MVRQSTIKILRHCCGHNTLDETKPLDGHDDPVKHIPCEQVTTRDTKLALAATPTRVIMPASLHNRNAKTVRVERKHSLFIVTDAITTRFHRYESFPSMRSSEGTGLALVAVLHMLPA